MLDCLIVGGGPAGLTAGIYMARFRRTVTIVDGGESRAAWIPQTHNLSGFPNGISGCELLNRMRSQAQKFGAPIVSARVVAVTRRDVGNFAAELSDGSELKSRTIILATGVIDVEPELPGLFDAVQQGLIRHCPVCDGYEAQNDSIAVLCPAKDPTKEALFLRTYSSRVTLIPGYSVVALTAHDRSLLTDAGINVIDAKIDHIDLTHGNSARLILEDGRELKFDTLYSALGTVARSDLAQQLRVQLTDEGRIITDRHQMTTIEAVYGIGDIVDGLNQISVAMGQAAVAACAIHNRLDRNMI